MNDFEKVQLIEITAERAGQRLDNYLFNLAREIPKSRIYRAIRKGEVRINKKRAKQDYKLVAGDTLRIPPLKVKPKTEYRANPETIEWLKNHILYEDDNVLVLNKPAGIAVHGGTDTNIGVINALRQASSEYANLELAHRIDKATSGCLILAKNIAALRDLHQQIKSNTIGKEYLCLAKGIWPEKEILVKAPLTKRGSVNGQNQVFVDYENGKPSQTEFHLHKQFQDSALVSANLITGRTHQIRVHCQHIGHPLAGDDKYGEREFNKNMQKFGLKRLFLHAHKVKFCLPDIKKEITVEAPLDDDLELCLKNLIN